MATHTELIEAWKELEEVAVTIGTGTVSYQSIDYYVRGASMK